MYQTPQHLSCLVDALKNLIPRRNLQPHYFQYHNYAYKQLSKYIGVLHWYSLDVLKKLVVGEIINHNNSMNFTIVRRNH